MEKIAYGQITLKCKFCNKTVTYEMKDTKSTYTHDLTPYTELGHVCDPENRIIAPLEIIKIQYYNRVRLYVNENTSVVSYVHPPLAIDWSKEGDKFNDMENDNERDN